jgi:DNA modification methylase
MKKLERYNEFLLSKVCIAPESGLDVQIPLIKFKDGTLKPHQRDAINWAIKGGRRALFESFGLGKTIQQLIICNYITNEVGGKALIVCPLGVKGEFYNDAQKKLFIDVEYVKTQNEVEKSKSNVLITNYERVRDGDINPQYFTVTSLDEASVLRSYGSKTYQTFLDKFKGVKYKYVCTATPSPNKYKELIHYAGYLEIMDTGQALTRFFKRDSTKANNLTLHESKQKEFWLWLSSWALFITKPSDLGYDDAGYDLPKMNVLYHKVKVDHKTAGTDQDGQVKLFRDAALGLKDAAREKRESMSERIEEMKRIILSYPDDQIVLWCDLNNEQQEIERMLKSIDVSFTSLYGNTDIDTREIELQKWKDKITRVFLSKPEMYGSGVNLQQCHVMIFAGINYEFNSFIQAIHRIYRFLQDREVNIHVIYAESEGEILKALNHKWKQHNHLVDQMTKIIKDNGLSNIHTMEKLKRSIINDIKVEKGKLYTAILSDCIPPIMDMPDNSIHLGVTSIPFSNHYEYTPTYNDFGHTSDNQHFFEQMDFLTPELLRILMPGRVFCVHVKDRILFGNATGTGMPTLDPFSDFTVLHFIKHGFQYMGRITVETDVVRENNQTYRLGWTEQCKDGSKMGIGCPEYVLLFRKLPSDTSRAYADIPVQKTKDEYPRGQWQIDARAKWNSSGERFLTPEEIRMLPIDKVNRFYSDYAAWKVYDYKEHCDTAHELDHVGKLPATFQTLNIPSRSFFVWDDVNRMLTLNGSQSQRKLNMHICPLQFDIVDRCINRFSNKNEIVFDPFAGLFTVPVRAVKMGRIGLGTELNPESFRDGLRYLKEAETDILSPTLFSMIEII